MVNFLFYNSESRVYIVIQETSLIQTDSIRIDISKKTDSLIRMKRVTIPSVGADEVLCYSLSANIVCSGQTLAEQGTHITVARLLWGFHFMKMKDSEGKQIDIDIFNYTNGLNWRPPPFECIIRPRSKRAEEIISKRRRSSP